MARLQVLYLSTRWGSTGRILSDDGLTTRTFLWSSTYCTLYVPLVTTCPVIVHTIYVRIYVLLPSPRKSLSSYLFYRARAYILRTHVSEYADDDDDITEIGWVQRAGLRPIVTPAPCVQRIHHI